jgi:hypothetical protein
VRPAAVVCLSAASALLIAAVPGPRPTVRAGAADEARALVLCADAAELLGAPWLEVASLRDAAADLGTAQLDGELCRDDQCSSYLPALLDARRHSAERAARALLDAARAKAAERHANP